MGAGVGTKKGEDLEDLRPCDKGELLGGDLRFFADSHCLLALAAAEVVEFGAASGASGLNFDFRDARGVNREHAFHAFAVGDTTDGHGFVDERAFAADYDARVNLNTLLVAFNNAGVNTNGVADVELGYVLFQLLALDFFDDFRHGLYLSKVRC